MKYYILSILLIASVSLIGLTPSGFADVEHGKNYNKEVLETFTDGSQKIKFQTTHERILNNGNYQDFIYSDLDTVKQVETQGGSVQVNETECSFNYFNKGFIDQGETPLFSDSMIPRMATTGSDVWNEITQITGATCETYWDESNKELVAKKYKAGIGFIEYKYKLVNGSWKTQLEATNLSSFTDKKFGFTQTIELNRDTIKFNDHVRNLDNFNGRTFDRTFLENNNMHVLDLLNGAYFDLDIGFDQLWAVTVTDPGLNKSRLSFDYTRNAPVILPNEPLIIDPSINPTTTDDDAIKDYDNDNLCEDTGGSYARQGSAIELFLAYVYNTAGTTDCVRGYTEFDISALPTSITVSDSYITYGVTQALTTGNTVEVYSSATQLSTRTATQAFDEIDDGVLMVSGNGDWLSTGDQTIDLTSVGDSELETLAGASQSWFSVGYRMTDEVLTASHEYVDISPSEESGTDPNLTVIYTTAPPPDSIEDLTLDSTTQTTATISFTLPDLNGESLQTNSFFLDTPQTNNVITFKVNSTANPLTLTGLTLGTAYSLNASSATAGGYNFTAVNILNFTTSTFTLPGAPTLSATALSDTAIRYTSVPGTAGDNSTIWYGLQCNLNSAGYTSIVANSSYVSFYEYTGLTLGDSNICQWRDGSVDGWSNWSNTATDTLSLAILSAQRGTTDPDDHLMAFIEMVSGFGGVYFGLGVVPFGIMLVGFMAGKKTVRIFTLATLMLMGIVHASGYYVFPNWYWTLCLLFGLVLIMGRMKSD